MFCTKCGCQCDPQHHYCIRCGTPLNNTDFNSTTNDLPPVVEAPPVADTPPVVEAPPIIEVPPVNETPYSFDDLPFIDTPPTIRTPPTPRKGRHWVPVLVMVFMLTAGLIGYWLIPFTGNSSGTSGTNGASETPWFYIEDNILYFYPEDYTGSSELVIPEEVDGQEVLYLGEYSFFDCDVLTTVVLPQSLLEIGDYSFSDCDGLRCIFVPNAVTKIGKSAFMSCTSLEAICISENVEQIGAKAFNGCDSIRYVFYDGGVIEWESLYSESFPSGTTLICDDGTFSQKQ